MLQIRFLSKLLNFSNIALRSFSQHFIRNKRITIVFKNCRG